MIARIQLGVAPERIARELGQPLPSGRRLHVRVEGLDSVLTGPVRPLAQGAFVAGVLVLLLCLGNATNLLVFRRLHRSHELQVRRAIGAGTIEIVRLIVAEAIVLAGAASGAALVVAATSLTFARVFLPERFTSLGKPTMSWRTVIFACAVAASVVFLATLLAEVRKAPRVTGLNVGRSAAGMRDARLFRVVLGGIQAALTVIFALGAVVLIQSYINLVRQDQGYGTNVSSATVNYPFSRPRPEIYHTLLETLVSLRRVPDVAAVAATTGPMVNGTYSQRAVAIDGQERSSDWTEVTPGFFDAAGMRILVGRAFDNHDEATAVAVVNDVLANKYWGDSSAVGKILTVGAQTFRVVGVVHGVFDKRLDERPTPTVYAPLTPDSTFPIVTFVLRSPIGRTPQDLGIRMAIAAAERDAVVQSLDSVQRRLSRSVQDTTFATYLLSVFGLVSTSVTLVGLLAVISFGVARRRRELAVRAALGAEPQHLQWLVASEAVRTAVVGSIAGLLVGHMLSTLLASLVYEVTLGSWITSVSAMALSVTVMVLTAFLAGRRATAIPPSEALRLE